jgi:hypothetical protein
MALTKLLLKNKNLLSRFFLGPNTFRNKEEGNGRGRAAVGGRVSGGRCAPQTQIVITPGTAANMRMSLAII